MALEIFMRELIYITILSCLQLFETGIIYLKKSDKPILSKALKGSWILTQDFPPSHYHAGTRLGQILHTRLRLECSPLNEHLYRRNLVNSPLCGEIENTTHFIFKCPLYSVPRQTYLAELTQHCTLKDLLYGKEGVNSTVNEDIFVRIHHFIIHSKKFKR